MKDLIKALWWWPILFFALFLQIQFGCVPVDKKPRQKPKPPTVEGIVTDVTIIPEDGHDSIVLIEFEDGRIQKLRMRNSATFQFQKNKWNVIEYEILYGSITNVRTRE